MCNMPKIKRNPPSLTAPTLTMEEVTLTNTATSRHLIMGFIWWRLVPSFPQDLL